MSEIDANDDEMKPTHSPGIVENGPSFTLPPRRDVLRYIPTNALYNADKTRM